MVLPTIHNDRLPEVLQRLPPYKVVVVDSSSYPLIGFDWSSCSKAEVSYWHMKLKLGAAREWGRTAAHELFEPDYVLHVDDDVVITDGHVSELLRTFGLDREIGIVGTCGAHYRDLAKARGEKIYYTTHVWCAGMMVRKEVSEACKFDHRLSYFEDLDYCLQCWDMGYRVVENAGAWVEHDCSVWDSAVVLEAALYLQKKWSHLSNLFKVRVEGDWIKNRVEKRVLEGWP
jgi:GT2 family glycosyltransferase